MPYEPGKPIEETARRALRELAPEQIVKLASNENPLGAVDFSSPKEAACGAALEEAHIYPDGGGWKLIAGAIAERARRST